MKLAWLLGVLLVFLPGCAPSNEVIISRVMTSLRTFQNTNVSSSALRNMTVTDSGRAVTNSESLFTFWYYEEEQVDGTTDTNAVRNNEDTRWFLCALDEQSFTPCGSAPEAGDVNNPTGQRGATRTYVLIRFKGHVFFLIMRLLVAV